MYSVIKKCKETGNISKKPRSGRPKVLNTCDFRLLIRKLGGGYNLATKMATGTKKMVYAENVRRILRRKGYNGSSPRRKPFNSQSEWKKTLKLSFEVPKWKVLIFGKKILFTDASKYMIYGCDGRGKISRKANQKLKHENMTATLKHGSSMVMI